MSPGEPRRRETGGGERPIDLDRGEGTSDTSDVDGGADAVSGLPAADLLHTVIGSARVVGAHRVAALAQDCEAALRGSGKDAPSQRERAALRAAVDEACGYIADLVDAA